MCGSPNTNPTGAARAELLAKTGAQDEARHAYEVAIGLERNPAVRRFLQRRQSALPADPPRQSGCGVSRLPSGLGIERPFMGHQQTKVARARTSALKRQADFANFR
jgi:hypothetical protein